MKKCCFLLMSCLMHSYSYADIPCVSAEGIESHSSEIQVKYHRDQGTIAVFLLAPEFIKGQRLKEIFLSKGNDGSIFLMPLSFESEKLVAKSYFFANESILFESKLVVHYQLNSGSCPSVIEIAMEHKPKYFENK